MTTCAGCRVRHLECDTTSPCTECEKAGRECVRLNVRFRNLVCPGIAGVDSSKYDFFFDGEQPWVDIERKLEFVVDTDGETGAETLFMDGQGAPSMHHLTPDPTVHLSIPNDDPPEYTTVVDHDTPLDNHSLGEGPDIPAYSLMGNGEKSIVATSRTSPESMAPTKELGWPLKSLRDGKLLQHFITHLAPWFDVGDSKRHFGKIAPCMAAASPLLMTAILAIAALHHSRVNGEDDLYNAMTFHDRCLGMLVPMLSDSDCGNDDCILMTTTILHLYDGLESGNDLTRHLKGTSIFFPGAAWLNTSDLRRAVFWLHLRQEIYNAYLYQRSVDTDLSNCTFESGHESGSDDIWFHRTLYIAAEVTKWAFGGEASLSRWHELRSMLNIWGTSRPATFDTIYFRARHPKGGRFFPEACYITDEHVAATHFFYLAKLLLTTYDPTLPRIGPRVKTATNTMQENALLCVRALVGIAICNNWVTARFTANLAVVICGSWFTDRQEQQALLDFLQDTRRCSGWSKDEAERGLMETWGWINKAPSP